ncbi:unnamed protein product [Heligmosomoides polygyrus]|uniref:CCDC92 domain-containing protein n=1 Tax=Heligmosomoides polygyrus TaxID=6339 RepID=A0A183GX70_HELPZ|nr:unnamed protein product [Heligmosomoides polygyrus]
MEEYEALRLLDIKKEKEVQVLLERISSLERAVQPCQMENINLHMKVSSLKKENEEYKITIHKLKAAEIEVSARAFHSHLFVENIIFFYLVSKVRRKL